MSSTPPGPRTWMVWAIAVAGATILIGVLILSLASDRLAQPSLQAFLVGWIVVPYVAGGLIAWWRRPASRLGPLMLLLGFTMALNPLQWSDRLLLHSIGHLFDMVPAAIFLHIFLAFPSGRLVHRHDRVVVLGCYVAALGLQLIKIILGVDPASVFVIGEPSPAADLVERSQLVLVAGCLLAGTVSLYAHRHRRPGQATVRPATLVVHTFGVALIALAMLYVAGLFAWPAAEAIRLITFAALGLAPIAFLIALLDLQIARGNVAALLVELRRDPTTDLQAPLARALRDPTLRLSYWLPDLGSWTDQAGTPTADPMMTQDQSIRVLIREGAPMAALTFDRSLESEPDLIDAVVATTGIAMENGRLRADLRARLTELTDSRARVLEAGRTERQRLERNLHDGAQARLVALSLDLGLLGADPTTGRQVSARLELAKAEVSASLAELRDIARGIYPAVLSGHGLGVALESLAAHSVVPVQLSIDLDGVGPNRPIETAEIAAYYVASEALANVGKHADAQVVQLRVWRSRSTLVIEVEDDGHGGAELEGGSGLRGLADRVDALGGRFQIGRPDTGGTVIRADIPC